MSFLTIPRTAPRQVASRARQDRLLRWLSIAVTMLTAAIAVLAVAAATVMLTMD
jgi:uncharacterized membrane protein